MSEAPSTVLVLDDDEDAAALLGMALRRRGYRMIVTSTCADARARLAEGGVDAVITDVSLPDGNGLALIASLAEKPRVVVVLTGFGSDEDREKSGAAGADLHVVKPVNVTNLAAKLAELLARRP
jgi:DNA-binding response OmpR family regulator